MNTKEEFYFNRTINKRFKRLVEESHMKQIEIAIALDTTATNVSRWMNCKNGISEPFFSRICRYFNVSSDWMNGFSKYRNDQERKKALYEQWNKEHPVGDSIFLVQDIERISNNQLHFQSDEQMNSYVSKVVEESLKVAENLGVGITKYEKAKRQRRRRND